MRWGSGKGRLKETVVKNRGDETGEKKEGLVVKDETLKKRLEEKVGGSGINNLP